MSYHRCDGTAGSAAEKRQRAGFSGKKKRHTLKVQYVIGPDGRIYDVSATYPGKIHDFNVYKKQKKRNRFHWIPKKADSGYQGINRFDSNAEIPFQKPKNGRLTPEQKAYNRELSKKRIKVENVIGETKIFKILSNVYRNRRRDHNIKTNIIAGIINMKNEKRNMKEAA
ncbi:MAG: transposase family protein [Okeania sp. SIO3C4]|nr:transposase family protein [Okeania sp. SIO3C4]